MWKFLIDRHSTAVSSDMVCVVDASKLMIDLLNLHFKDGDFDYCKFSNYLSYTTFPRVTVSFFYCYDSPTKLGLTWYRCGDYIDFADVTFYYEWSIDRQPHQITLNDVKF